MIGASEGPHYALSPEEARGSSYLPRSNVLLLPGGGVMYVPEGGDSPVTASGMDAGARASVRESRAWLAAGIVPGESEFEREIAARSLLNLRLLTDPSGAALAAPNPRWDYVWPRDASWMSAAFSVTEHREEARSILDFLARVRDERGWEARYTPDGRPVPDGRPAQLDANGWFLWAVWVYAETGEGYKEVRDLWPEVRRAAEEAVGALGSDGLPPGGADYWERRTLLPNLGNSAALLVGLRSAQDLAAGLGHEREADRYRRSADRLEDAVHRRLGPRAFADGYTRTTSPASGRDAAVTFLAPPFGREREGLRGEVISTEEALTAPNGGVLPGERWPQEPTVSWTPESAFFMLSAAASGDRERAGRWLRWLAEHRTLLGAFPEKVDGDGEPQAAAPLAWTDATVLLALAAGDGLLPGPPGEMG